MDAGRGGPQSGRGPRPAPTPPVAFIVMKRPAPELFRSPSFGIEAKWGFTWALPVTCCATPGEFLSLSVPPFPHLEKGSDLLPAFNEIIRGGGGAAAGEKHTHTYPSPGCYVHRSLSSGCGNSFVSPGPLLQAVVTTCMECGLTQRK